MHAPTPSTANVQSSSQLLSLADVGVTDTFVVATAGRGRNLLAIEGSVLLGASIPSDNRVRRLGGFLLQIGAEETDEES